ncbi:anti-sigma factor antagonist [Anaerofustis stercorihominis]|uniref:STAS domain-containing protein n=1 Tax=Anaerofustis stercorihominis TaxID=214853 RepID=UPI003993E831
MNFEINIAGNTLTIKIKGALDDHVTLDLRENIDYALCKKEIKNLIFDLSELTFMDSAGIGLFMGRYKKISAQNGKCGLVTKDKQIIKILRMSGILSIFDLFNTLEEGIEKYENR